MRYVEDGEGESSQEAEAPTGIHLLLTLHLVLSLQALKPDLSLLAPEQRTLQERSIEHLEKGEWKALWELGL